MATNVQVRIVKVGFDVLSTHVPIPTGDSPVDAEVIASVSGDSVESSITIPTEAASTRWLSTRRRSAPRTSS